MKNIYVVVLIVLFSMDLFAGVPVDGTRPYACAPRTVSAGIVYTDNYSTTLYLRRADGSISQLAAAPGAGQYYTLSPDRGTIGMKLIGNDGLQTPAVIDVSTGTVTPLAAAARRAGQVSFTSDGRFAYTLGDQLIVTDGATNVRTVDLGTYANIAPISPDGRAAVYNDADDQLIMIDIATGTRTQITQKGKGYFQPQWSPDGRCILFSSLSGSLFVYDCAARSTAALGEGLSAAWSDDSREIAFYRKEISDGVLVNSDIYCASADGATLRRITQTPDVCEMDPSFAADASTLLYQTYERSEIVTAGLRQTDQGGSAATGGKFIPGANTAARTMAADIAVPVQTIHVAVEPHLGPAPAASVSAVDMPYINQVYDTPDWFNGHSACGPTTAMMALAYFKILPPWETSCATPSRHTNNWGNYISETYSFRGSTYYLSANDPNGRPAQGAFGYMWGSGSPYSRMSNFYGAHGIASVTFDSPSHASAAGELIAGNIYSICNGLTTAGHIVQAHTVDAGESHSIIVNDPYGNKNKPGYPNNYGKDAKYDWPGYNNGNQNFNTVWWASTVHYTQPAAADSIVDDLQINRGFSMNAMKPSSMSLWKEKLKGYNGHFWHVYTTYSDSVDTCYAVWTPTLDKAGRYEVFASIPFFSGTFSTIAKYKIFSKEGLRTVTIDQRAIGKSITADTLVSLGTYTFDKGTVGYVRLGDATGAKNEILIFDAIVWKYKGAAVTSVERNAAPVTGFALGQNFPNPFNPSTRITYRLPAASRVELSVVDVLGRVRAVLVDGVQAQGDHAVVWNAEHDPAGVYFCRIRAEETSGNGTITDMKKMLLVR